MNLNALLARAVDATLNKLLPLDPDAITRLDKLQGKSIHVHLTDWGADLYFLIGEAGIKVSDRFGEEEVDASLSGTSFAFFNMSLAERGEDYLFKGDVRFAGEIGTAQEFQRYFRNLHIDWEEQLARLTGDIIAHQFGRGARELADWVSRTGETLRQNTGEYLQHEARVTPATIELENFFDEVANLKADTERLAQRIARLQKKADL